MPLIELWESNPEQIEQYAIDQIVAFAGGKESLRDGNSCAAELREYLSKVPTHTLASHVDKCLSASFKDSGYVLQDIVNELGRRLDYDVENGLYQGKKGSIGFDGLWGLAGGHSLVVEVKTTDAYRINLDTIAKYRSALIAAGKISEDNSSMLIVVGRQDTGDIEAQVRGSRHAWDVRLISADALIRLVDLKEKTDEDETLTKIQSLLVPFEYTRLDNIIDVVFAAAQDVEAAVEGEAQEVSEEQGVSQNGSGGYVQQHTPQAVMAEIRKKIVKAISAREGVSLIAHKRSLFWSPDHKVRAIASVSKFYNVGNGYYWYGFHPSWKAFLEGSEEGYHVLGCVGQNYAFALPKDVILDVLDNLNISEKDGELHHWHIHVELDGSSDAYLVEHKTGNRIPLKKFRVQL